MRQLANSNFYILRANFLKQFTSAGKLFLQVIQFKYFKRIMFY